MTETQAAMVTKRILAFVGVQGAMHAMPGRQQTAAATAAAAAAAAGAPA